MNTASIKELLDRIIETKFKENGFFYANPVRPQPGLPASDAQLRALDAYLAKRGLTAPASYRRFLSIYNGIEQVLGPFLSLLPVERVILDDHGLMEEMIEEFPNCSQFIIGAGDMADIVAFDTSNSPDADYEVVWITGDAREWRLKNFDEFLASYLATLERNVLAQQKDRENLAP